MVLVVAFFSIVPVVALPLLLLLPRKPPPGPPKPPPGPLNTKQNEKHNEKHRLARPRGCFGGEESEFEVKNAEK